LRFRLKDDRRRHPAPYVEVARGGARIGASVAWRAVDRVARAASQGVELVREVDDLQAECDAVTAAGWPLAADVTHRPWGTSDFRLHDLDGYYVRVTTRRR
jgi:uncharacterized glyoxalase superfamily protein PhnB